MELHDGPDQGSESASLTEQPQLGWSDKRQAEFERGEPQLQRVGQEAPGKDQEQLSLINSVNTTSSKDM